MREDKTNFQNPLIRAKSIPRMNTKARVYSLSAVKCVFVPEGVTFIHRKDGEHLSFMFHLSSDFPNTWFIAGVYCPILEVFAGLKFI